MLVSMPADSMPSFSRLAMVDDVTGLCRLMKEINSCVASPLNALVLSM